MSTLTQAALSTERRKSAEGVQLTGDSMILDVGLCEVFPKNASDVNAGIRDDDERAKASARAGVPRHSLKRLRYHPVAIVGMLAPLLPGWLMPPNVPTVPEDALSPIVDWP